MEMQETLGDYVARIRELRGYSVRKLAELADMSKDTINRIEKNKVGLSKKSALALANALEVEPITLTSLSNQRANDLKRGALSVTERVPTVRTGGRATSARDDLEHALAELMKLAKVGLAMPLVEGYIRSALEKME